MTSPLSASVRHPEILIYTDHQ
ncbi:unnamed protein product [Spirodela intermedia]|uniref:Uncharacterized protein n=2 Tax=Spirodela intermedia TaxID=51605 RepID=A0A7I8IRN6_SPIIN|nr:unnamed protein product [Spirodela intermedia]CAA6660651.1 unnamed protein product [Spirodela intermedia]CAA7397018.1 unnamed protein product [Spirodela intermedia]